MTDYPLPAFHFAVSFDGSSVDASFQEVGGFGPEMETEAFHEGGENRFVHQLPKGVKAPRLVLKRGVAELDSPLVRWCRDTLEHGLVLAVEPKAVLVSLLDGEGQVARRWLFDRAWPAKWTLDGFRANKNEVALEVIELHFGAVSRVQ